MCYKYKMYGCDYPQKEKVSKTERDRKEERERAESEQAKDGCY